MELKHMKKILIGIAAFLSFNTFAANLTYEVQTEINNQALTVTLSFDNESLGFVPDYNGGYTIDNADLRVDTDSSNLTYDSARLTFFNYGGGVTGMRIESLNGFFAIDLNSQSSLALSRPDSFSGIDNVPLDFVIVRSIDNDMYGQTYPHITSTITASEELDTDWPTLPIDNTITISGSNYMGLVVATITYSEADLASGFMNEIGGYYYYEMENAHVSILGADGAIEFTGVTMSIGEDGNFTANQHYTTLNGFYSVWTVAPNMPADLTNDPNVQLNIQAGNLDANDYVTGMYLFANLHENSTITFASEAGGCVAPELVEYAMAGQFNGQDFVMNVSYELTDLVEVASYGSTTLYESANATVVFAFEANETITLRGVRMSNMSTPWGMNKVRFEEMYIPGQNINNFMVSVMHGTPSGAQDVSPDTEAEFSTLSYFSYASFYLTDHNKYGSGGINSSEFTKSAVQGDCPN